MRLRHTSTWLMFIAHIMSAGISILIISDEAQLNAYGNFKRLFCVPGAAGHTPSSPD
jgi:hypothetical protein